MGRVVVCVRNNQTRAPMHYRDDMHPGVLRVLQERSVLQPRVPARGLAGAQAGVRAAGGRAGVKPPAHTRPSVRPVTKQKVL